MSHLPAWKIVAAREAAARRVPQPAVASSASRWSCSHCERTWQWVVGVRPPRDKHGRVLCQPCADRLGVPSIQRTRRKPATTSRPESTTADVAQIMDAWAARVRSSRRLTSR